MHEASTVLMCQASPMSMTVEGGYGNRYCGTVSTVCMVDG